MYTASDRKNINWWLLPDEQLWELLGTYNGKLQMSYSSINVNWSDHELADIWCLKS